VYEALHRISEGYRAPLVLCYLEGKTQDEAAIVLGVSKATVKKRMERGRALLTGRLVRRGLGPVAVLAAAAWPLATASAKPVPLLVSSTVKAATQIASGQAAAVGLVSTNVIAHFGGPLTICLYPTFLSFEETDLRVMITGKVGKGMASHVDCESVSKDIHPVAEIEFPHRVRDKGPIRVKVPLDRRC
jgi:hypothetical protein